MNDQHAEAIEAWKGNLVCLCVPNMLALSELLCRLQRQGFAVASFSEPDLGGELTAIAVEGSAGRQLSSLPLAIREPPLARVA